MERINPKLLLNYHRPIGQVWRSAINNGLPVREFITGRVFVFPEILVPSAPSDNAMNLTSLANTIYVAAREHNMSLSSFGHLDPVKFVVAATYLGLYLEEIRRDLSLPTKFEFGNRTLGEMLCYAFTGTGVGTITSALPSLVTRFNMLIKRFNNLYMPAIHLLEKWLPHRTCIYRDDNGDRYQYYGYVMANYYKLDVNPNSATVGQLLYVDKDVTKSISSKLTEVETLIGQYESDDDFVNFAVEASKAGLPRVTLVEIGATDNAVKCPVLVENFDIDDVLGLENAYFVTPVVDTLGGLFGTAMFTWDIKENTTTGRFEVGKCNGVADRLPVAHPFAYLAKYLNNNAWPNMSTDFCGDAVSARPVFTHAQIESEDGLAIMSRYIAAVANNSFQSGQIAIKEQYPTGFVTTTVGAQQKLFTYLVTHSSTMLMAPYAYGAGPTGAPVRDTSVYDVWNGCYVIIDTGSGVSYEDAVVRLFGGFKAVPYHYQIDPNDTTVPADPMWRDFDYVVCIDDVNLNLFNASLLWNDFTLLSEGKSSGRSGQDKRPKRK